METAFLTHFRLNALTVLLCATFTLRFNLTLKALEPDIPHSTGGKEPGSIQQQIELAAAYLTGRGVNRDEKMGAYWYEKAAAAGQPRAQEQIGYFYQIGLGVSRDPVRAAHWFQLAADGGLASAKTNLGVAYIWGAGVPMDLTFARELFREAAEKGNGLGACYLGEMYFNGFGVQQDQALAEHWYEKSAQLHDARGEFRLATLLSKAESPPANLPRVVHLFRQSVDAGYVPSMYSLGLLLVRHPELAKPNDDAVKLLNDSAAAGDWKSSAVLGMLARDGKFVQVDRKAAYYRFRVASSQGGEIASQYLAHDLQILREKLGSQDTAAIDFQAASWYRQHSRVLEFIYKGGENWKLFPAFALAHPEEGSMAGQLITTNPFSQ